MASQSTGTTGLAGRYATALFDLAQERHAIDTVNGDLARLQAMIDDSSDLRRLIKSPLFSSDEQGAAMAAIIERAGLSKIVANFVAVIARNRRLFALEDMIGAWRELLARHRGEVTAEVTSATALSDAQQSALQQALKEATGSTVAVSHEIDPGLLGGLVVRVGSLMIDSSLRTKLHRLQLAMKGAA